MGRLLGLMILILDILAIFDCAKSRKDIVKKVLWALIILILPVLGLIGYYWVEKKR